MRGKLVRKESIADLWGYPDCGFLQKAPETRDLFSEVVAEAHACLYKTDWDVRIKRIENILSVVKARMRKHWEEGHASDVDKILKKAKEVRLV